MYERFTDRARKVMQLANQEAQRFNHECIGTDHILLGLIKEASEPGAATPWLFRAINNFLGLKQRPGVAANVLENLGVDLQRIRQEIEKVIVSGPEPTPKGKRPRTPRAQIAIRRAIEEARSLNHKYVGTEHLLLGLLREGEGLAAEVLTDIGLTVERVRREAVQLLH